MPTTWNKLRSWNGSQNFAFEELCCQLARYEQVPEGSKFTRKGTPDAGVECFWELPNGDEWGWQAKFFTSSPNNSQWGELDKSVKRVLDSHPRLTKYTICLALDRSDSRKRSQKSCLEKWNDHVEKWQVWAGEKGKSVKFEYWGDHEIWERLSREEHRGRRFFWFNEEFFSQQWFQDRLEVEIADAGPRYTPELNVDLPIAQLFDGLGRTSAFYTRLKVLYGKIKRRYSRARFERVKEHCKDKLASLNEKVNHLLKILEEIEELGILKIDIGTIIELASESAIIAVECNDILREADEERRKTLTQDDKKTLTHSREEYESERHSLYELTSHLHSLENYIQTEEVALANIPALLLVGDAGTGKTHLLCDVAKRRVNEGLPTVLLLGGHFTDDEPWTQIIKQLGVSCKTRDELLGVLEAAAQAKEKRAILMIDALNESQGKKLWKPCIAGILQELSRYPWVGLAISVRTSYIKAIIPETLVPNKLIQMAHRGFSNLEYKATEKFFEYYKIEHPSIPLLSPEFGNPLFLKLFCEGLHNRGLTKVPPGLKGVTSVFVFFVDSVNDKLSDLLDFDIKDKYVQKVVEELAGLMAERGKTWLPRDEAKAAIEALLTPKGYDLFRQMISEGLLSTDMFPILDGDKWRYEEGIRFAYERFSDHLIAKHLLDKHLDSKNPSQSFLPDQTLGSLVKDEGESIKNKGLVEAFSTQVPEQVGKELAELAPLCSDFWAVRDAFVESLIWRDPQYITEATLKYINEHVITYRDTNEKFLDALLTITTNPDHPYKADFLHAYLMRFELSERDAWWSIFIHEQYGREGAVDRLVDWAWSSEDKSNISDDSIRLCGIALSWFLTTSNRFLRDRATKALVSLFTERIHLLREVISMFLGVNDLYVLERLFAVAHGCAMRSTNDEEIGKLAQDIYGWIFKDGNPPVHILLRDYARGVIEVALSRGVQLKIVKKRIRPPYESEWPSEIPTVSELEDKYEPDTDSKSDADSGQYYLYSSVMGFSDFARYIIGTNSGMFEWSLRPLYGPRKPTMKQIYDSFIQSLTDRQRRAWEKYQKTKFNSRLLRGLDSERMIELLGRELDEEEIKEIVNRSERSFRKTLGKKKTRILDESVLPHVNGPYRDEIAFDLSIVQRWILQRVFELGWTKELFGEFDCRIKRFGYDMREPNKAERIGKKYQWIAYHEFLARVSDNFEFRGRLGSATSKKYDGPWQVGYIRDIDPSCLLKETGRERWAQGPTNTWRFTPTYNNWNSPQDDVEWLRENKDIPSIERLIEVKCPKDKSRWLVLEEFCNWQQPTPPEEEPFDSPRRDIYLKLRSYIVKKSDIDELFEWAKKQNFMGQWMPQSREILNIFLGEFFWAPACKPFRRHDAWTRDYRKRLPRKVLVTTAEYLIEGRGYDCSIDESIDIYLPAKWLIEKMGLRWNGVEGHFFDEEVNLIAFDPSVKTPGPQALLINRDVFLKFLTDNGYDILWTIIGEKQIIGGHHDYKGYLNISGTARILENELKVVINTKFFPPRS